MNKRQAIKECREEANAIIEQHERWAKGWDKGMFRDDDTEQLMGIAESIDCSVQYAFELSAMYGQRE